MKFSDGEWLMQPGVSAFYPAEAHDVTEESGTLLIHAPTRPINHRGDTLGGPLLTIRLSSPMADVVHVRIEHFSGTAEHNPRIPLQAQAAPKILIENGPTEAVLRSGALGVHVKKNGWEVAFESDGRVLTRSTGRGMGFIQYAGRGTFVHERLHLGVGENVYGLGERFTAFVKNGQVVENDNRDGGTGSEQAYKSVPFYLTNRGYGVLVNETGPVSFEVAAERTARV
jgi:alpha-D-xyloside xylohydrolase